MAPVTKNKTCGSILIVSPEVPLDHTLSSILDEQGYQVELAETVNEGRSKASQHRYDLILLDSTTQNAELLPALPSLIQQFLPLPVVVTVFADADSQRKVELIKMGAFDLLTKPYQLPELKVVFHRVQVERRLKGHAEKISRRLHKSEEYFKSVVQASPDAIVLGDSGGTILSWNDAAQQMFGYTLEEIIGQPLTRLMPSRYHHAHQEGLARVSRTHQTKVIGHTVELEALRRDGTEFPIELSLSYSHVDDDIFYCGILRDITERKKAEKALLERNRLLALDADVGQIIGRNQELSPLLQACAETLVHHLEVALVRIWLLEPNEQDLTLIASAGLSTQVDGAHGRIPVGHLNVGQIALDKKPILTNSVVGDPRFPDLEWAKREDLVAFAGYPLLRGQAVLGVMAMYSKHPLTEFTMNSLEMVADRISTAIEFKRTMEMNGKLARLNEQMLASAGDGIFGVTPEGTMTFANPAAANMLGYHLEEMQDLPIFASIHPTNRDGTSCIKEGCSLLKVFMDGVPRQDDREVFYRKDGTSLPVEYSATPMCENGEVTGSVVIFKDISMRKRAEEAQERFCQQIGATLAALPGSIFVVDEAQHVLYANPEAHRSFGRDSVPLVGCPIHEVLPFTPVEWTKLKEEFSQRREEGKLEHPELEFEVGDRIYAYCLFPISLDGWNVSETGMVIWDITERKKLQDQLIQSEKLSSLGTLVSGMVHEVRSPMQSIVGYTELIQQEEDIQTIQEYTEDLKRVSAHILTVLTEFMTYARPSAHEVASEADLNERLAEALKMVQRGPTFGKVEVAQQFSALPMVLVRQGEIDQVFINLMGNAVQAMNGVGRLRLATFHNDGIVTVQIGDTGCGISKDNLQKIFDPFFSTKGKGKGTGLGLSIVQQIVKRCGGHISVESDVGKGTTFTIQLPASSKA